METNLEKKTNTLEQDDNEMERQLSACDSLFRDAANFVVFNQIPGDYYEFGVYQGNALLRVNHWMKTHWNEFKQTIVGKDIEAGKKDNFVTQKRFFVFDSFEGLPGSEEASTPVHFYEGAYSASEVEFWKNVDSSSDRPQTLHAIKGWYDDTLTDETKKQHEMDKAAMIFIDCDLWESCVVVMPFITSLIQQGTVIIVDDYFRYRGSKSKGVRKAFEDWAALDNGIEVEELGRCSANRVAFLCHTE